MSEEKQKLELTANNVFRVLCDCFFKEEELKNGVPIVDEYVSVDGIVRKFGFNKERLFGHKQDIIDLIDQLPDFSEGVSFLNLPFTKDGVQWGEQINAEQLIVLGIGIGVLEELLPRKDWVFCPSSVPFIWKSSEQNMERSLQNN